MAYPNDWTAGEQLTAADANKVKKSVVVADVTAGATINGATLPVPVYFDDATNEWYACDANVQTALEFQGFAITNGTDGVAGMDIVTDGVVDGFTGLTQGARYYVQDAAGTIGTTVGTYECYVGIALTTTQILIDKGCRSAMQYMGTANDSADVITVPADARMAIVQLNPSSADRTYTYQVTVFRVGETQATITTLHDYAGAVHLMTAVASWSGSSITLTYGGSATSITGTAWFYR